jgi:hypothetical protein
MMGLGKRLGFGTKVKQHFFKSSDLQECIKPAEKREGLFTGGLVAWHFVESYGRWSFCALHHVSSARLAGVTQ